jgi:hypothetical protein
MSKIKKGTRVNYFKINKQGWDKDLGREEVQIYCGKNGNLMVIKTDEGYIVDAYDVNGEIINTMAIWEDDINPPSDEDEIDNTDITDEDIVQFKKDWGQTHSGITAELGYPRSHEQSDGLLMEDYFWIEKDKRWYNRCASMFTPKEQRISDYLYGLSTYQYLNEKH